MRSDDICCTRERDREGVCEWREREGGVRGWREREWDGEIERGWGARERVCVREREMERGMGEEERE